MSDKKVLPKIPTLVSKQPASAAIVSKLITSKQERAQERKKPVNLPDISNNIKEHLRNTDDIMTLFPDIELISQILVSSILSPNDMLTPRIS